MGHGIAFGGMIKVGQQGVRVRDRVLVRAKGGPYPGSYPLVEGQVGGGQATLLQALPALLAANRDTRRMSLKNVKLTALVSTMVLLTTLMIASAQAGEKKVKISIAGSFISSRIDSNSDGAPASYLTGTGKSNLGNISFQSQNEPDFSHFPPPVTTCPNGQPGFSLPIVQGSAVYQAGDDADLLFTQTTSAANCFPLSCFPAGGLVKGCVFFVDTKALITGGTGKFAGARGALETSGSATILFIDATSLFGGFTTAGTGTVNTP